ncbi:tyrosine-type recombinase/integrase [Marinobacterium stanieri]|uniref:tyrosine-type recombinase/integrase n=1 Tax=Marinobacterium stanieri TaxID=49186 RepID=UPI003A8E4F0C
MKRSGIKRRPMADSVLKSLEPEDKDYQEKDSPGLYFRVKKGGTKSWNLRYKRPNGKWAWMGLGGYPAVSGKAAREEAERLLKLAADGEDLKSHKATEAAPGDDKVLFETVAEDWFQRKIDAGRAPGSTRQMRMYLDSDIYPVLAGIPIDEVTRSQCTEVQRRLEKRKALNIAKKVRSWISQIFTQAIAEELCDLNPASELRHVAEKQPETKHYPFLLEAELPEFFQALKQSPSRKIALTLVRLVLRTACRPGMARLAKWTEFDLDDALWVIPAKRMKMRRDHVIPLSHQAVAELRELHELTGRSAYLFPGNGSVNPTLSENTINNALSLIGYKGRLVGHGARHTASTLLREHGWQRDFVETHLAHVEKGVAGVYNKAQYLKQRREMMQWYSDYLDALENGGKVPADP